MKKYLKYIMLSVILPVFTACDYLDIVPEKTEDIMFLFEQRTSAYRALATCYHYLPVHDGVYACEAMASDELTVNLLQGGIPGRDIMRGNQNTTTPLMGYWFDTQLVIRQQESVYKGIHACNTLIDNIDHVYDMLDEEKAQWKAEAIFLKAYYHFMLFSQYGPIPIMDKVIPISATAEEMRVPRAPVDEVVEYIVKTIDKAIQEGLIERTTSLQDFGRVDQVVAAAIKARVLLYAASPLFNGNVAYYQDFTDKKGNHYFNLTYDVTKWEAAAKAAEDAIRLAQANDVRMYYYDTLQNKPLPEDLRAMRMPRFSESMMADYSYRYMFYDSWNSETIWGDSYPTLRRSNIYHSLQAAAMPMQPTGNNNGAWSWAVPTYEAVDAYYSSNGLPISEDLKWNNGNYENRFRNAPAQNIDSFHVVYRQSVPAVHLGREPRFYATIGFDRSYYNIWGTKWSLKCKYTEDNGRKTLSTKDYSLTGYFLKKPCHQQSLGDAYSKLIVYPWPIIRMAELYLTYAEAMNEAYGPSQEVYDALNEVRKRAGIPNVEDVWSDATIAKTHNKHTTKEGLREIIRQERRIELAFEGQRNYDVRRWLEGDKYFNVPVKGWSVDQSTPNGYYNNGQGPVTVMQRSFITPRDYLYPIKYSEMNKNSELVQNPGW